MWAIRGATLGTMLVEASLLLSNGEIKYRTAMQYFLFLTFFAVPAHMYGVFSGKAGAFDTYTSYILPVISMTFVGYIIASTKGNRARYNLINLIRAYIIMGIVIAIGSIGGIL